jgi:hypothetical protein
MSSKPVRCLVPVAPVLELLPVVAESLDVVPDADSSLEALSLSPTPASVLALVLESVEARRTLASSCLESTTCTCSAAAKPVAQRATASVTIATRPTARRLRRWLPRLRSILCNKLVPKQGLRSSLGCCVAVSSSSEAAGLCSRPFRALRLCAAVLLSTACRSPLPVLSRAKGNATRGRLHG